MRSHALQAIHLQMLRTDRRKTLGSQNCDLLAQIFAQQGSPRVHCRFFSNFVALRATKSTHGIENPRVDDGKTPVFDA